MANLDGCNGSLQPGNERYVDQGLSGKRNCGETLKIFKVTVSAGGGKNNANFLYHAHTVKAGNKAALERRLKNMEIINGREHVQIEEIGKVVKIECRNKM